MLNNDAETQWEFVKGKGYATVVANNLSAPEMLNLSAVARFENMSIAIGKTYQGGIIFYLDSTGEHGLIAAPADQGTGIQWYNGAYIATGATGTGLANTKKIVTTQGTGSYAAKLCFNLVIGAYSDWYLPSKDELALMYTTIGPGAAAPLTNVGGFSSDYYWSSSEYGGYSAWYQDFSAGSQSYGSKLTTRHARAVRAF